MTKLKIHKLRSKGKFKPGGWIIRKNQKTKHNHYAMSWMDSNGKHYATDAKSKGIRVIPHKDLMKKYYDAEAVVNVDLPIPLADWEAWVTSKLGTKYPFWQLIGIGLISWGIIRSNPFGKNKRYLVCHEYVLVAIARFKKICLEDTDDYTFRKADKVIDSVKVV